MDSYTKKYLENLTAPPSLQVYKTQIYTRRGHRVLEVLLMETSFLKHFRKHRDSLSEAKYSQDFRKTREKNFAARQS
jgi:hypothetical protein